MVNQRRHADMQKTVCHSFVLCVNIKSQQKIVEKIRVDYRDPLKNTVKANQPPQNSSYCLSVACKYDEYHGLFLTALILDIANGSQK